MEMKKIVMIHGDVTLCAADSIPKTAKKVVWEPGFILEKGEGVHTHTIENECEIYVDEKSGRMYLKEKTGPIVVNHEEHGKQQILSPTKIVYKEIEQEFDYESMEARNTMD
jgi:hypothetical protein